jgi:D-3-phosphoglycerate dehydrogenase
VSDRRVNHRTLPRVFCDESYPSESARDALRGVADVESRARPWSGEDVAGILVELDAVTDGTLGAVSSLRVVATASVGTDHIDVQAATRRGVWVCNVPDYCLDEMADHALALLLSLARGVVELDRQVRAGAWDHTLAGPLRRVADLRLGIVGFGRIGRAVATRARALGMHVLAYDPVVPAATIEAAGARPASLDELLRTCDAISLHAPLTAETRGLLGRDEIALLPSGALVVNVSRGALVDTAALLEALEEGRLSGVALDVLDVEPPTPQEPAPSAPRLIVTPHAGWYSEHAAEAAYRRAAESVRDVLEGRRPRGAINDPLASR